MILKVGGKSVKFTPIDRKITVLFLQLSLIVLILLGCGLAPIGSLAQSIPNSNSSRSPPTSFNPGTPSTLGPGPTGFPPPPISPESAAQKSASTTVSEKIFCKKMGCGKDKLMAQQVQKTVHTV